LIFDPRSFLSESELTRKLFPFRFATRASDTSLFYKFYHQCCVLTLAAAISAPVLIVRNFVDQRTFVYDLFPTLPLLIVAALVPLAMVSTIDFFRSNDCRTYITYNWNPFFRKKPGRFRKIRAELVSGAMAIAIISFPQGLFLLLIEEYHAVSPTYVLATAYAITLLFLIPAAATILFIAITAFIADAIQLFQKKTI
jgi:hypothetical protein